MTAAGQPAGTGTGRDAERASWRLTLVAGLLAALPVIVSSARAAAAGWEPIGDQGFIATRAYDVLTAHTPLVGGYSFASRATGHPTYHAGPLLHWLLALPAHTGLPWTLEATMGVANAAAIVAAVALARRRGGVVLMLATAFALAVMCHSLSSENLHAIFNPAAAVLPFTLLIFLCWSLACGDYRLLPVTVLVASFTVQCHLVFLAPTAGLLACGLGLFAWQRRRVGPQATGRGATRRWVAAALAVAAACWSAPLVDQLTHRPGNLHLLVTAATSRKATEGPTPGWRAVVRAVGVPPRWLRPPGIVADHVSYISGGDYGDTRMNDIWTSPGVVATASCILLLALLAGAGVIATRRGRADIAAAAAIGLVLCATLAAVVAATPGNTATSIGYIIWWGSAVGMWVWLILGWSALELTRLRTQFGTERAGALVPVAGVALLAITAAAVAAVEKPDAHASDYRPVGVLRAALDRAVARGSTIRLATRGNLLVRYGPAIDYALRRRNVRLVGSGASLLLTDKWYELGHTRYDRALSVYEGGSPPIKPARVVAQVSVADRGGTHTIAVAVSPAGGG